MISDATVLPLPLKCPVEPQDQARRFTWRAALHEAGHAVMHTALRLRNLDQVSIIPDPATQTWGRNRVRYFDYEFLNMGPPTGTAR